MDPKHSAVKRLYYIQNFYDTYFSALQECDFTNNTSIISQNPRVTAINTCLEIDITGQVCSDSIGTYMYSGEFYCHLSRN